MKYKNWEKWLSNNNEDSKKVFDYWLKAKEQFGGIIVNFFDSVEKTFESIELQYIDKKFKDFSGYFNKKHDLDLNGHHELIKYYIKDIDIKNKDFIKSVESAFRYNKVTAKNEKLFYIANCIEKSSVFLKFKKLDDVINILEKDDNYKIVNNILILEIKTKEKLEKYSSPVWCTNYSSKQVTEYIRLYNVYFAWIEEDNELKMYGLNFLKNVADVNISEEMVLFNSFDYLDRMVSNEDVEKILKSIKNENEIRKTNNFILFLSKYILEEKINSLTLFLLLKNYEKKEIIMEVIKNLKYEDIVSLIKDINFYYGQKNYNTLKEVIFENKKLQEYFLNYLLNGESANITMVDYLVTYLENNNVKEKDINFDSFVKKLHENKEKIPKNKITKLKDVIERSSFAVLFEDYFDSSFYNSIKKEKITIDQAIEIIKLKKDKKLARFFLKKYKDTNLLNEVLNSNIDIKEILSIKEREEFWINVDENSIYERNVVLYFSDNSINKEKILLEKAKNKTLKLYLLALTNKNITRKISRKVKSILNPIHYSNDVFIENFKVNKIKKIDYSLLFWLKYSKVFINNISEYIDGNKKIIKKVINELTDKDFIKQNKYIRTYICSRINEIMLNYVDYLKEEEIINFSSKMDTRGFSENKCLPFLLLNKNNFKIKKKMFGLKKINILNLDKNFDDFIEKEIKTVSYLFFENNKEDFLNISKLIMIKTKNLSLLKKMKINKIIKEVSKKYD